MAKVIPISSIICNNIKPLKATEQQIALDIINLFSRIHLGSSKPHMSYISAELQIKEVICEANICRFKNLEAFVLV